MCSYLRVPPSQYVGMALPKGSHPKSDLLNRRRRRLPFPFLPSIGDPSFPFHRCRSNLSPNHRSVLLVSPSSFFDRRQVHQSNLLSATKSFLFYRCWLPRSDLSSPSSTVGRLSLFAFSYRRSALALDLSSLQLLDVASVAPFLPSVAKALDYPSTTVQIPPKIQNKKKVPAPKFDYSPSIVKLGFPLVAVLWFLGCLGIFLGLPIASASTTLPDAIFSRLVGRVVPSRVRTHPARLFTDGSSKNRQLVAGGGVLRDHTSMLVFGFSENIGSSNSLQAELQVLLRGLLLCQEYNINNLWIEVDALVVIQMIQYSQKGSHDIRYLLESIRKYLQNISYRNSHIYRESNQAANFCLIKATVIRIFVYLLKHEANYVILVHR
ncbi:Uncharacterized protein TCM_041142 [Theobroma cacao]|uniref:RNase H type-1 domain-containing protein n=1 Tax=Theobroma cacao TaxID=3641 RepID=A0A061GTM6_THECC|nr:Uncharacterized protein TCM_041142 [Theobroma cacao]